MSRDQLAVDLFLDIQNVNLSDDVRAMRLFLDYGQRETTGLSGAKARTFTQDYTSGFLQVEFYADYANHKVMRTLTDLQGQEAFVQCNPYSSSHSASRPRYQFHVLVTGVDAINSRHGLPSTFQVSFPITGVVRKTPDAYFRTRMVCGETTSGGDTILGWRRTGSSNIYGSIGTWDIPGADIPGGSAGDPDAEIVGLTYNRQDRQLDFFLNDNTDAALLAGSWLVAGPQVFQMTGAPNIGSGSAWRQSNVPDPGWTNGFRVKIELWDEDPTA